MFKLMGKKISTFLAENFCLSKPVCILYFRCIDRILGEQLNKFRITLQDIKTLESAEVTAIDRLTEVRASMKISKVSVDWL